MRASTAPRRDGRLDEPGVEDLARHDEVGPVQLGRDLGAARATRSAAGGRGRGRPARRPRRARASSSSACGRDAVAARLVAREVGPVEQQHPGVRARAQRATAPPPSRPVRRRRPRRPRCPARLTGWSTCPSPARRTRARPRVLSGIRPTGSGFHLGNYLGAVRHWAAMQDEAECFFFLADLHALTELPDPAQLRERTRGSAAELLAMGVDPARSAVFAQSPPARARRAGVGARLPHRLRRGAAA